MSRCTNCGQFGGEEEGHTCPEWANPDTSRTCQIEGCEEVLNSDQDRFCSPEHYNQWQRERPADTKECELEGCTNQHTNEKYCSRPCQDDARRKIKDEPDIELSQDKYFIARDHDGNPDQVVFSIEGRLVRVPFERWDRICRDYSDYGGSMTQAEVARKHGAPLPLVKRALSAYGQYHASPPMARERLAEADELEPLFSEAIETQEQQFLVELERRQEKKVRREWKEMKKKLRDESRFVEAGRKVASELDVPEVPKLTTETPARWPAVLAPTTDEHMGLPVWGEGSWGENYDTDIAARRIVGQGKAGAGWLEEQGGAETVYRAYTGDLFNSIYGSTTHDTRMDQDTRDERVWDLALEAVLTNAQAWRQVCDELVILFVSGNHDGPKVYQFASSIRFALQEHDDVEVRATPKKYDAVRVGESLHVFDHGASLSKLSGYKAQVDAEKIARKAGGEEYHGTDHIFYHVGHKHDRAVVSVGDHLEIIRHPALCESSEYEHEGRWIAKPCADVLALDEKGRIDTPKRFHREKLDGVV